LAVLQELVVSPHNRRVNRVAFAVLRNNTLTAMQYLKGSSMYWRVSQDVLYSRVLHIQVPM
jgi:hypothetical protein